MTRVADVLAEYDEGEIERLDTLSKSHAPESRAADIVAERRLNGNFRYAPGLGWLEWNGLRWDDDLVIEDRVAEVVRRFIDQTEHEQNIQLAELKEKIRAEYSRIMSRVADEDRTDEKGKPVAEATLFDQYATEDEKAAFQKLVAERERLSIQREMWLNLLSGSKISALVRLCRRQGGILTRASEFDAHPDLLNCTNGVVDLRTGELLTHDPDLLLTKVAGGAYVPGATSPLWDQALEAVPASIREWAQARFGQSLTGHTPDDDALIVAAGEGENGKSAIMIGIMRAAGMYGQPISHRVLMVQPGQHPTELMDLRGLRFALLEETPEEGRLDTHQLKTTVGTPTITARRMRKDSITFACSHSMWVNTNHLPQVDATDHGTWRRLKAMPFPYKFLKPHEEPGEKHERRGDPSIKPRLAAEDGVAEAALAWAVAGAVRWYQNQRAAPQDPPLVVEETARWRAVSDVGFQFAIEYLVSDERAYITAENMRIEFSEFLRGQGKPEWSAKTINTRLGPSMRAAGVEVQTDPTKTTKIRTADVQSRPVVQWSSASKDPKPGDKVRVWRGVRFKTEDDRARERREAQEEERENGLQLVPAGA